MPFVVLDQTHDLFFSCAHTALVLPLVHVVVAEQVQHGVHRQIADLMRETVAVGLGLLGAALHGDDHVAEHGALGLVVPLAGVGVECAGRELIHRKRQHVRRPVDAALLAVDGVDGGIVRERHIELTRDGHALGPERRGGCALDIALRVREAESPARAGDGDLGLCHAFFLTVVLRAAGFLAAAAACFSLCLSSCS